MSHTPDSETPLEASSGDRWWAIICLSLLAGVSIWAGVICYRLLKVPPPIVAAVDHGPLPAEVRTKALAILALDLKDVQFEEHWENGARDFHVNGTPKPQFSKAFTDRFKVDVVDQLMPLLRPYGELVSFDIYNYDYAPVRLRALPRKD